MFEHEIASVQRPESLVSGGAFHRARIGGAAQAVEARAWLAEVT